MTAFDRFLAMRLFTRIVELSSFSRAAEQLTLPRASATQIVKQLEKRLGTQLLARTTRSVAVTPDGQVYYQRCLGILADMDEAEAIFCERDRPPQGVLRLDIAGPLCRLVLMPALPAFTARYPGIRLEVGVGDRPIDVLREGVDCVLRIGELRDWPLVARRLSEFPQVTCASADYLEAWGEPTTLDEIGGHQMVGYLSPSTGKALPLAFLVDGSLESRELPAQVAVNNGEAYVAAALAGFGIIQVSRYLVADALREGRLREILVPWQPPPLPLHVLFPSGRQLSVRLRVFLDWLEQLFTSDRQ